MPIDQFAAFIEQEKHLPNIPTYDDVKKSGSINLTDMQIRVLEKVEELALYTIQQNVQIAELSAENAILKKQMEILAERLASLEK